MSEAYEAIEVSAATVDDAIKEALDKLGAAEDDVIIQVLSTPRAGVLGLGARQARVRVVRRPPEAATSGVTSPPPAPPLPARSAEPRRPAPTPRPAPPPAAERQQAAEETRALERPAARQAPPPPRERYPRPEERPRPSAPPRPERRAEGGAEEPAEEAGAGEEEAGMGARKPADLDAQAAEASSILSRILELMGERGDITVTEEDIEGIELAIKGDGSGLLIGRHGQTLDALEYLVNRVLARKVKDAVPITIDTESYRERRRRQLNRMALSMAEQSKREHAAVTLEPMPPRDRRIVHLALKDDPLIATRSTGEGFLRAVEIIPVGERSEGGGGGGGGRRERGGGGGGRGRQRGREREGERPRESERPREGEAPIGQQGGFKHGQKRII